jgi:NADH-quinone oxidoreductase subunit L
MLAWIPLFPLIGFLINGSWYAFGQAPSGRKKAGAGLTGAIATLAIAASFVVSLSLFLQLKEMPVETRFIEQTLFQWMTVGSDFNLALSFRLDPLNSLFTLVITGIGTLIHLYSIGYMGSDETPGKFFAYLNLFCFSMLVLVLGAALPILFFGWEGVGLCSYLLIGYWYTDIEKAKAGKKAFVVNRVGDLGFLLGMFMILTHYGTLEFAKLAASTTAVPVEALTAIGLLLFVGCMGKSAQIPLYVWLPDAMAGPTPVSALIHAATMVTSGIYMVARLNFIYTQAPSALHVVAIVGAFTAFFAATIALVQTDIKKVLAYSTVSQLGYMFLGCGVGAYVAGVFHVITHAFFKALLFLGAGSVIHGMHHEQEILKMGGLKKYMPVTYFTWIVGWLAICGVPPFAGFFSKDEILWQTFSSSHGSIVLWALAAVTAVMTAFYMTRLTSLTFWGTPRFNTQDHGSHHAHHGHDDGHGHGHGHGLPHESPWMMVLPLVILAVLSATGGLMGIPHHSWLDHWLEPVIPAHHASTVSADLEWILMGVSVVGALLGILVGWSSFKDLAKAEEWKKRWAGVHHVLMNKWMVDEIYEAIFIRPIQSLSKGLWQGFDVGVIDRVVLGFGRVTAWTGQTVRVMQTGSIQTYIFVLLVGIATTVGYLVYGLIQ